MAFVINDGCIGCGACAGTCPVGAISQGDGKYEISADASPAAHVQAAALLVLSLRLKSGSARKSASACFPCSFIPAGERLVNA